MHLDRISSVQRQRAVRRTLAALHTMASIQSDNCSWDVTCSPTRDRPAESHRTLTNTTSGPPTHRNTYSAELPPALSCSIGEGIEHLTGSGTVAGHWCSEARGIDKVLPTGEALGIDVVLNTNSSSSGVSRSSAGSQARFTASCST